MTISRTAAWCAAVVIVGLVLVMGAWEPASGPPRSTFQDGRLPR